MAPPAELPWLLERTKVDGLRSEFRLTNRTGLAIAQLAIRCDGCEFEGRMGDPLLLTDGVAEFAVFTPAAPDSANPPRMRIAWGDGDTGGSWDSLFP